MRPLKLTMSAFGTFAKETVIDFEQLSRNGVFLISGNNGSGKTTIFDAISFALYGKTCNAKRRENRHMHSDFASIQEKTIVNLEFLHQEHIFLVKRILSFTESAKTPIHKAFLYQRQSGEDRLIKEGQENVNKKIQEMLGMTQGEFNQTVMIAQGEFQQIVNTETKNRINLFRKLFHTEIYNEFEAKLQDRHKVLEKQFADCQKKMRDALKSLKFHEDKNFHPDFPRDANCAEMYRNADCAEMYLNAIRLQNLADQELFANLESKKQNCKREQESLIRKIEQAKQNNQKLQDLSQHQDALRQAEAQLTEIQEKEQQLQLARDALQVTHVEDALFRTENKLICQKKTQDALQSRLFSQKTAFQNAEENLRIANQNAEEIPALIQRKSELEKALPKYEELRKAETNVRKYDGLVQELTFRYDTESRKYDQIFEDFCLGQAGLLAKNLKPGMKCPVCGSTNHPDIAVIHPHTPSREQVDKAEKSRNDADKNLKNASQTCAEYHSRLETLRKENPLLAQYNEQTLLQELTECSRRIQQLNQEQKSAQKTMESAKSSYEKSLVQLQEAGEQIKNLEQELEQNQQAFRDALEQYHFPSPEAYQNAELSPDAIRKLEQEIRNFQAQLQKCRALTEKSLEETAGLEYTHIEDLEMQKYQKDQQYSKLESEWRELRLSSDENQEIAQNLPGMIRNYREISQQFQDYDEIYKTVSGTKGNGQAKFKLEAYVQQYYFKGVIQRANQRLAILTNQKFELRCREMAKNNTSQSGLDLEIRDFSTDQWRDVSTLSGGESFMLALSLALGLSDIIQESNGGIRIDAMFIDEGFGSLDETSLNQAIELLGKLSDGKRLIGVISHVESLINRIDAKICVTKNADGSEVTIIN